MSRTAEDPWEAHVISELRGRSEICTRVILGTLGLEQSRQTKADAMRVSGIIIRAGWRRDGKYSSGDYKGLSRYVAPDRGRTPRVEPPPRRASQIDIPVEGGTSGTFFHATHGVYVRY